jgi:acetyl esterase/lipase
MKAFASRTLTLMTISAALAAGLNAQPATQPGNPPMTTPTDFPVPRTIPLWEAGAPGALGSRPEDKPFLTVFAPSAKLPTARTAVIVAPGGSYTMLANTGEGRMVADWFASRGISAFVLSYRLIPAGYHHPSQLTDAQRAVRLVRTRAAEFGVDPQRIGIIGFSAGGHLATMVGTQGDDGNPAASDPIDRASSRISFMVLAYPGALRPEARQRALLGDHPNPAAADQVYAERHITAQTPPTFIYGTTDDETVAATGLVGFYNLLHAAGVPVEMHLFEHGRHGSGLGQTDPALRLWPSLLENWLDRHGLLRPPATTP